MKGVAGVYISYPFCAQKCTYCNFASGVFPRSLEDEFQDALVSEIRGHEWRWIPETVYLGGGTPSQMPPLHLEAMLAMIPGKPWKESTLEAAPGGITREKIRVWRRSGIGRISLGVQSFVRGEIARTGRKHTAEVVEAEVALLRKENLGNINIDLIAGLAGQTRESWLESLGWIERLQPPHVSVYMLEVDEDSRLGLEILNNGSRYGARDIPSEEMTAEFYETAVERLAAMGIERYEISNFAQPGAESAHNLKYWRREPYIGFGPDAHSFDRGVRWQNVESPAEYVERKRQGLGSSLSPATSDAVEEKFFVGLRLSEGVAPTEEEWDRFAQPIRRLLDSGLLERDGGRLRLTGRGVLLSNEVFQEFLIS